MPESAQKVFSTMKLFVGGVTEEFELVSFLPKGTAETTEDWVMHQGLELGAISDAYMCFLLYAGSGHFPPDWHRGKAVILFPSIVFSAGHAFMAHGLVPEDHGEWRIRLFWLRDGFDERFRFIRTVKRGRLVPEPAAHPEGVPCLLSPVREPREISTEAVDMEGPDGASFTFELISVLEDGEDFLQWHELRARAITYGAVTDPQWLLRFFREQENIPASWCREAFTIVAPDLANEDGFIFGISDKDGAGGMWLLGMYASVGDAYEEECRFLRIVKKR